MGKEGHEGVYGSCLYSGQAVEEDHRSYQRQLWNGYAATILIYTHERDLEEEEEGEEEKNNGAREDDEPRKSSWWEQ